MKKILIFLVVAFLALPSFAQDIHFSQFYNSPLTLNPALTGKMNGAYRVGFIYRNQWFQSSPTGTPFLTYSGSVDAPIRLKKDAIGVGLVAFQDNAGEGYLNTLNIMASAAYHKALGKNSKHSLSLGVQLGYIQKKFDEADINFFKEYDGTVLNPNKDDGETFNTGANGNFDFNVGLMWNSMIGKRSAIYAGGSLFHVIAPENNFIAQTSFDLQRRYSVTGGADIGIGEKFSILPSLVFLYQDKARELNAGAALAYAFTPGFTWFLGGYYRIQDAPIAYTAFEFKGFRLGLSYDFVTSDLENLNKPGAIEMSLMFVGKTKALPNPNSLLFCPRF